MAILERRYMFQRKSFLVSMLNFGGPSSQGWLGWWMQILKWDKLKPWSGALHSLLPPAPKRVLKDATILVVNVTRRGYVPYLYNYKNCSYTMFLPLFLAHMHIFMNLKTLDIEVVCLWLMPFLCDIVLTYSFPLEQMQHRYYTEQIHTAHTHTRTHIYIYVYIYI